MLSGKQKSYLRSKAHHLKPVFQIGKSGVTENLNHQLVDVLEKRELIKINVLQNCLEDKNDIAKEIAHATHAEIVQIIGNIIVLYKESDESKEIKLPN